MLTVLLITYNHKDYFRKSIESVLSQKTNFDFKIEVHDDSSTDGTSDLLREYAQKYPEKIIANIHEKNLGAFLNGYEAIKNVKTKYFAILETDDYWCDDTKLQQQVDALELNPNCSFCGHNTIQFNPKENNFADKPFYNQKTGLKKISDIKFYNEIKVHISSRVYRTSCINYKTLKYEENICWDSTSFWYFLDKGDLYYIDKVMSVYNYTHKGIYTGATIMQQKQLALNNLININDELDFRYNKIFLKQIKLIVKMNNFKYLMFKFFTPSRKLSRKLRKFIENYLMIHFSVKYFMSVESNNMGDLLNKYMVEKFISKNTISVNAINCNLSVIGSVLEMVLFSTQKTREPLHIWGSGFIEEQKVDEEKFSRPVIIHALRGHLSKIRCKKALNINNDNIVLGDPGLLANKLLDHTLIEKKYDVGIIPHYIDKNSKYLANIKLEKYSSIIIDISGSTIEVLKQIASCKVILSSAMHGLIVSDSFNVPNQWIQLSDNLIGNGYKFKDYYSVFNIDNPRSIDLRKEIITDKAVDAIQKNYKITPKLVENINNNLLNVLPKYEVFK